MSTPAQKYACFSVTRAVIFALICVTILTEEPISDVCAIISAGCWLWLPNIVALELKLLDKLKKSRSKDEKSNI